MTAPREIDARRREVLDRVAGFVVKRQLQPIAVFFLESTKPMHHLAAQFASFFDPFAAMIFTKGEYVVLRESLEDKDCVEYLLQSIEKG